VSLLDLARLITDLGDSGLTASLTVILTLYLLHQGQRRAAFAMALSFAATSAFVTLGKIMLYSHCASYDVLSSPLRSPSGHTALSLSVYGAAALIVASSMTGLWRAVLPAAALILAFLIGVTRVLIGAHSVADVVVGFVIGLVVLAVLWRYVLKDTEVRCAWRRVALICFLWCALLFGLHMPSEQIIKWIAGLFKASGRIC
jgi:membrane-associated phospholipid phosphatase